MAPCRHVHLVGINEYNLPKIWAFTPMFGSPTYNRPVICGLTTRLAIPFDGVASAGELCLPDETPRSHRAWMLAAGAAARLVLANVFVFTLDRKPEACRHVNGATSG